MALMSQTYDLDPMIAKPPVDPYTGPATADPDLDSNMIPGAASQTPAKTAAVGEIGSTPPAAPPAPTSTPVQTPTPRTVDATRETVAGQLNSILDADSPLLQRARARSNENMNSRGLVNSSMANSAALDAVLQSALPIASADAGVYGQAARDTYSAQTEASSDIRRQTFQQDNMRLAQALDTGSRERLMAIEQNYRQITNGSNQAGALLQDMQSRIGAILANAEIPAENKQGLIDKLIDSSMRSATLIGAIQGIDLSDIFGTGG